MSGCFEIITTHTNLIAGSRQRLLATLNDLVESSFQSDAKRNIPNT